MSRGYNWAHPNTAGHGGGRGKIEKTDLSEIVLTRAQRAAFNEFRAYQREEVRAVNAAAEAVKQQQIAIAQMANAGLKIKRIAEITQYKETKVRDMIDHGRIHLGEEVPDNG